MIDDKINSLKIRQQRFVYEYSKDFNATQAAIRAGYSQRSAYNQAYRMMKNDEIQRCLYDLLELSLTSLKNILEHCPPGSTSLKASTLGINLWMNAHGYEIKKYV